MIEILPNWHPIFVHFSIGLLVTSALMHLLVMLVSNESSKQTLACVANWNLWIGTGFTVLTVAAGWFAYNSVTHDTPSHLAMIEHRNWAIATFIAYLGVAFWSYWRTKNKATIQWPIVGAIGIASILLLSTAWHGGELVYRYGLGVQSLPSTDEHAHAEGEEHAHDRGAGKTSHDHADIGHNDNHRDDKAALRDEAILGTGVDSEADAKAPTGDPESKNREQPHGDHSHDAQPDMKPPTGATAVQPEKHHDDGHDHHEHSH